MSRRDAVQPDEGAQSLPTRWEDLRHAQERVIARAAQHGYTGASLFAVRLSLEEALANAFKHGNRKDEGKSIHLSWRIAPDRIVLTVRDEGEGFEPTDVPDPTSPEFIERPHGRGVMLIRAYMTDVEFADRGREVRMVYERPEDAPAS